MKRFFFGVLAFLIISCKEKAKPALTAQKIVDTSIAASGGDLYATHGTSFQFRNRKYVSKKENGKKIFQRISVLDSITIKDVMTTTTFQRFINDSLISLPDSISSRYANSVNSVHYFTRLPYGLNDKAVNKELLGEETIKGKSYYKIKVIG